MASSLVASLPFYGLRVLCKTLIIGPVHRICHMSQESSRFKREQGGLRLRTDKLRVRHGYISISPSIRHVSVSEAVPGAIECLSAMHFIAFCSGTYRSVLNLSGVHL